MKQPRSACAIIGWLVILREFLLGGLRGKAADIAGLPRRANIRGTACFQIRPRSPTAVGLPGLRKASRPCSWGQQRRPLAR